MRLVGLDLRLFKVGQYPVILGLRCCVVGKPGQHHLRCNHTVFADLDGEFGREAADILRKARLVVVHAL